MSIHKILTHFSFIFLCSLFLIHAPARADSEFSTVFTSTYQIELDGKSLVTHEIKLTNRLSHIYPTKYTILVDSGVENISTTQDGSIVNHLADTGENSTTITFHELAPVVGQGQATALTVSYLSSGITEHLGRTSSINIPRLSRANEAEEFTRIVLLPEQMGLPTVEFPPAASVASAADGFTQLTYKGHGSSSLSLLFGNSEYYELDLTYEITNPTLAAAETEIALPPDTAYQRVLLDKLDPPPLHIQTDSDGNWLAVYSLKSKETRMVTAKLFIESFASPRAKSALPDTKALTKDLPFWNTNDSAVRDLATRLSTPVNIYEYLVNNLTYDRTRLESGSGKRLGATAALKDPSSAICTEFTDTFVALARSAGIPAREHNGYAYTDNPELRPTGTAGEILHSWPEFYDVNNSVWVQIDPTWAHTTGGIDYFHKLDFNHISFVIHGLESDYPLPAGAYKQSPDLSTISVRLADQIPAQIANLTEVKTEQGVLVQNLGNTADRHPKAGYLPPYGSALVNTSTQLSDSLTLPKLYPYLLFAIIVTLVFVAIHRLKKSR